MSIIIILSLVAKGLALGVGFDVTFYNSEYSSVSVGDAALTARYLGTMGVNQISFVPIRLQKLLNSTQILPNTQFPSFSTLETYIDAFQSEPTLKGAKFWLKPMVDCECGVWRANIGRTFSPEQWTTWFASYNEYMGEMADFATKLKLDGMVIGTEMVSATSLAPSFWRTGTIPKIRSAFAGNLTYAANWGFEVQNVTFFDLLDFVGVDAYYPLSDHPSPSLEEVLEAWKPVMGNMSALAQKWKKQVIFTEVGYRSVADAAEGPGNYHGSSPPDTKAQVVLYKALMEAAGGYDSASKSWHTPSFMAGIQLWAMPLAVNSGVGVCDIGYSPRGKPAAEYLAQVLNGSISDIPNVSKSSSTKSISVYSNGDFGSSWSSWSFSGVFDPKSSTPPLIPGHSYDFAANQVRPFGGYSFHSSNPPVFTSTNISTATIQFSIRAPTNNLTSFLNVAYCDTYDCSDSQTRAVSLLQYISNQTCTVPSSWNNATSPPTVFVPLLDMLPLDDKGNVVLPANITRLNIVNDMTLPARLNIVNDMTSDNHNLTLFLDDVSIAF